MCCVLWSHWVLPFPWVNFPAESRCALPKQSLLLTLTQVLLSGGFHLFYLRLSFHQRLVALQKLELVCVQVKLFQGTMVFTQTKCCEYTCPDNECKLYMGCSLKCLSEFFVVLSPHQLEQIEDDGSSYLPFTCWRGGKNNVHGRGNMAWGPTIVAPPPWPLTILTASF